jgi:hypothetical protein
VSAIDLNTPGTYLHWNVFTISAANLALICAMLVIFLVALLAPFPGHRRADAARDGTAEAATSDVADDEPAASAPERSGQPSRSWTVRVRRAGLRWLPPGRLLPEHQPSYVASWVYVFGVASLAAFVVAVVSGFLIALGGVDWWHTNPAGHFFNSMHLWSVELFMACMVIHLWAKFFMAAWRGRRARTWITGVLAFVFSIGEAFTGYLSQTNFDSQWISTNGKDAFNAAGIGGFFDVMNFGQMLLWHVVLLPLVLVVVIGLHILFVRYRGVVHPFPARSGRDAVGQRISEPAAAATDAQPNRRTRRRLARQADAGEWRGPRRPYDLIREATAALAVVLAATFALAGVLSSPDVRSVTIRGWATAAPGDFLATAVAELDGTSETATYGPPYNHGDAFVQRIGISWQDLAGVLRRIDPAEAFVVRPLTAFSVARPTLAAALTSYRSASHAQQVAWATNYATGLNKAHLVAGQPVLPPGHYGPVAIMLSDELTMARAGGLDASLVAGHPFYGSDLTEPLLFLEDGSYFGALAHAQHLQGDQWGVMNETGSYPGQPWLWLYQLWYHLPRFRTSTNVDLIALYLTGLATLLLALIPFIPGLRSLPRWLRVYRLIWRRYYREAEKPAAAGTFPDPGLSPAGGASEPEA